jgi:hypothetical protein
MRAALLFSIFTSVAIFSSAQAQAPKVEVQAGLGYARVFDGGGLSFAAAVERHLSSPTSRLRHALGGSFWYARTSIATAPNDPYGRRLLGLGLRYQLGLGRSRSVLPFVAVPVQLLRSNIPDRTDILSAQLQAHGVPDPGSPRPVEDLIGAEWGWGAGVELGLRGRLGRQLSAQTSVQAMYQDIYKSGTRHGAWSWHAGLTYGFGNR